MSKVPSAATIVLITGANKGIGLETSRQLASPPYNYHVLMASRDPGRGEKATSSLRKEGLSVDFVPLDVTDDDSINAAAKLVNERYGHIDVLINNAGIAVEHFGDRPARQAWKDTFDTNVFGVAAVTDAFIPLLKKSVNPPSRIVFVSSDLGRLETKYDPNHKYFKRPLPVYSSSKAAMDMLALHYAKDFRAGWGADESGNGGGVEWKINVTCPGPTKTDFNGNRAPQPVEEGARNAVRLAVLGQDGETGTMSGNEGPLPW
ncbi:putative carbonyl reductase [Hyaloscypha variabilis F]|uniref:Putative carbonyl reductase n=1 Tax=Hyaloscypha variabilis (strain UAMH 11265 / GT02V1 / F) TaxID=1149755 RepID=A0A2J6QYK5_HYAVF|nr:putative carbonyl reductase [Hyaloscypha variabilis F]